MISINKELCSGCGLCVSDCVRKLLKISTTESIVTQVGFECMKCGHCESICPTNAITLEDDDYEAYINFDLRNVKIDPLNLANFMAYRRSVRSYTDERVKQEDIDMIINAGRFSPTGCNNQTVGYIIIKENVQEFRKIASAKLTGDVLNNISATVNKVTLERIYNSANTDEDRLFFDAPLVIAITDIKENSIDAAIAASRMEMMANALGLGVCFNGIFTKISNIEPEIRKMCGLNDGRRVITTLVIGHPAVSYQRPPKRKKGLIVEIS